MPDEQAFLRKILSEPEDDLPRLIYADWLEERGDPRAEFIRLQCEVDGLETYHPQAVAAAEKLRLLDVERGGEWRREATQYFKNSRAVLRRGFVEHLSLPLELFLSQGGQLFEVAPVRSVKLNDGKEAVPVLADCVFLEQVRALSLNSVQMGGRRAARFLQSPHLKNLRELDLGNNGLGDLGLKALADCPGLPNLETLWLNSSRVTNKGLALLGESENFPRLKKLYLDDNNTTKFDDAALRELADSRLLKQLTHLSLDGCYNCVSNGVRTLLESPRLGPLEALNLSQLSLSQASLDALVTSRCVETLRELHLHNCSLSESHIQSLAGSVNLTALRYLNLSFNDLDPGALVLSRANWGGQIWGLSLVGSDVTDLGGTALFSSPLMEQVHQLSLRENMLGDESIKTLAASPALSHLRELDLAMNHIGTPGVQALMESLHWNQIHRLILSQNQLTTEALPILAASPHLATIKVLHLAGHPMQSDHLLTLLTSPHAVNLEEMNLWRADCDDACAEALLNHPRLQTVSLYHQPRLSETSRKRLLKKFGDKCLV